MTLTTSKPVSELARKLASGISPVFFQQLAESDAKLLHDEIYAAVEHAATLTRKQTIEECARVIEAKREAQPEIVSDYQEGRDVGLVIAAAAIREMEVKEGIGR